MPLLSNRWFVITTTTVLLFLIFLVGTPLLISQLAKQWLLDNGGEQVRIQDIDFNPFTAQLLIKGCEIQVNDKTTLLFDSVGMDIAWWPLFKKRILVQSVSLNGFDVTIDDQAEDVFVLGGLIFPKAAEAQVQEDAAEPVGWLSGIDTLTLNDVRIALVDDKLKADVKFEAFEVRGLSQWSPEQATPLSAIGTINDAPFRLDGTISPFAEHPDYQLKLSIQQLPLNMLEMLAAPAAQRLNGRFSYTGDLNFKQQGDVLLFNETGKIHLEQVDITLAEPQMDIRNDAFVINGKLGMEQDSAGLKLTLDSVINLDKFSVTERTGKPAQYSADRIAFEGSLALNKNDDDLSFSEDGKLTVKTLDVALANPDLVIKNSDLAISGDMDFAQTVSGQDITLNSSINLKGLNVSGRQHALELFVAETLTLDTLAVRSLENISLAALTATKIGAGRSADIPQKDAFQYVEKLEVSKLAVDRQLVSIDSIDYQGGHSNIRREADGKLRIVSLLEAINKLTESEQQPAVAQDRDKPEPAPALGFTIGRIRVDDTSKISFYDASVQPVFQMVLNFKAGLLENLDTRKPDQPSRLDISGITDRHTEISITGDVKPFSKAHSFDLTGKIAGMGLPAISPYTQESLGLIMDSGSMDADITMASKDQVLDGNADLKIHQLVFKNVDSANSLQSKIPVPLNIALDTLRDKNNTIALKIPVSGDAGSPGFGLSDAISKALAGGVSKGALTYLKFALQPYGALITAAEYAGEAITKVHLDPVVFEPGQSQLSDKYLDYLTKLAAMLKERPQLAIKVCGVAVQADQTYFQEQNKQKEKDSKQKPDRKAQDFTPQLTGLASQRADIVRDYLINTHQSEAGRLVECQPRVVTKKEEVQPRTDLLI